MVNKSKVDHVTFKSAWECEICRNILNAYQKILDERLNKISDEDSKILEYKKEIKVWLSGRSGHLHPDKITSKAQKYIDNHLIKNGVLNLDVTPSELFKHGVKRSTFHEHVKEMRYYKIIIRANHGHYRVGPNVGKQYYHLWEITNKFERYEPNEASWHHFNKKESVGFFGIGSESLSEKERIKIAKRVVAVVRKNLKDRIIPETIVIQISAFDEL